MAEEGTTIVLNDNKNQTINKEENNNEIRLNADINDYNQESLDVKENLKENLPKNEQLGFNEKKIYELSLETIEKLGLSPCQICQSNNYSIFIPETLYNVSNQNGKPQDQAIQNENPNLFFPILICQKSHQTCLICNNSPHINNLCNQNSIDYNQAISKLNIIKEIFPEKANVIESMKESASTLNKKVDQGYDKEQNGCCCFLTILGKAIILSILYLIWLVISMSFVSLSINIIFFSLIIDLFYTICKALCGKCCGCDSSVDLEIACFGYRLAKTLICLIPKGFQKLKSCILKND